jgi:hypothetical protein
VLAAHEAKRRHIVRMIKLSVVINWKLFGRERWWPNFKYYPDSKDLEEPQSTRQDSVPLGRDLKPGLLKHKARVILTSLRCSVVQGRGLVHGNRSTKNM